MAGDERGSGVEVYLRDTGLMIADGDADAYGVPSSNTDRSATHFAMTTRLSHAEVVAIAAREGWPAKYRKRGGVFGVIEILTAEMQHEYLQAMTIPGWRKAFLAAGLATAMAGFGA